jgi:hypothetical protein
MKGQIVEFENMLPEERIKALRWVAGKSVKHPSVWGAFTLQILGFILLLQITKSVTAMPLRLFLGVAYAYPTLFFVRMIYQKKQNFFVKAYLAENPQLQK